MPDFSNNTISIPERQALLTALPYFAMLTSAESKELTSLMEEVSYAAGEMIVEEDALVDSVYIITSGQAEVTRTLLSKKNTITKVPVGVLNASEAIGLNDTGFFSTTGKRTATVTALSKIQALKLDLKSLHQFFKRHVHLQSSMYAATEQMLRVRLIKQSLPFSKLSYERMQWLASQIEAISVPAGTVIFKQGELGDRCYLIRSGQIEISAKEEDSAKHQLAILKTPTLFGEATLITHSPRNATARAMEDSELLVLQHKNLSELMETEANVADMFMTLMVDRSRPLQCADITTHRRMTADKQEIVILKNPRNRNYFKLSNEGWFIWQQLNGKHTMREITMNFANEFNTFAPNIVVALISKLAKGGFIEQVEARDTHQFDNQPFWVRGLLRLRNLLEARVAFGDADKWLTRVYQKGIHFLFTPIAQVILALAAMTGFVVFCYKTGWTIETFQIIPHTWLLLLCLIPGAIVSVALHELGHAFSTKAFGYEVHYMGVGWYWVAPVAFTDTSDMWLSTRGPRTIVNLAGIYTDILIAGVSALLMLVILNPYVQVFLWLLALFAYINAFRMLSPLQELDGYYVLMDLADRPHLRQSAIKWLVNEFPKALRQPSLFKKHVPEIVYWLACIIYLVLTVVLIWLLQKFVFKILGIHASNPMLSLIFPFFVTLISSLGIIAEIRSQVKNRRAVREY